MGKIKKIDNTDLTSEIAMAAPKKLTAAEIGIEFGVPVTRRGEPDLYNHRPSKFISLEDAQRRGIAWFFDGTSCRNGHVAAKRTVNKFICSDCEKIKRGEPTVYGVARHQKFYEMKDPATTAESNTAPAATASLGLNGTDTKFLEHYARERDLAKAAKAAGTTPELVMARRVGHPGFGEAMSALEQQLEIPKYTQIGAGFEWDDTKRSSFIEHYINSGEIDSARQAVGCTRSQYFAEIKRNTQFANDVEAARPFAESVVEEAFIRAAKQGQQSILPKYMEIIEKRDAQRLDTPSDPTKARAELQKMLGEVQARFNKERAWRIISTGVVVPRPQLEKIFLFRDRKTGATYKPEEVEDVTALLWNQQQNNAAALAAAPDMAAASPDAAPEYYNTASDARDDDLLTGEDLT